MEYQRFACGDSGRVAGECTCKVGRVSYDERVSSRAWRFGGLHAQPGGATRVRMFLHAVHPLGQLGEDFGFRECRQSYRFERAVCWAREDITDRDLQLAN